MGNFEAPAPSNPGVMQAQKIQDLEARLTRLERSKELIITPIQGQINTGANPTFSTPVTWTGGRAYMYLAHSVISGASSGISVTVKQVFEAGNNLGYLVDGYTPAVSRRFPMNNGFFRLDLNFKTGGVTPGTMPLTFSFFEISPSTSVDVSLVGFIMEWPTS